MKPFYELGQVPSRTKARPSSANPSSLNLILTSAFSPILIQQSQYQSQKQRPHLATSNNSGLVKMSEASQSIVPALHVSNKNISDQINAKFLVKGLQIRKESVTHLNCPTNKKDLQKQQFHAGSNKKAVQKPEILQKQHIQKKSGYIGAFNEAQWKVQAQHRSLVSQNIEQEILDFDSFFLGSTDKIQSENKKHGKKSRQFARVSLAGRIYQKQGCRMLSSAGRTRPSNYNYAEKSNSGNNCNITLNQSKVVDTCKKQDICGYTNMKGSLSAKVLTKYKRPQTAAASRPVQVSNNQTQKKQLTVGNNNKFVGFDEDYIDLTPVPSFSKRGHQRPMSAVKSMDKNSSSTKNLSKVKTHESISFNFNMPSAARLSSYAQKKANSNHQNSNKISPFSVQESNKKSLVNQIQAAAVQGEYESVDPKRQLIEKIKKAMQHRKQNIKSEEYFEHSHSLDRNPQRSGVVEQEQVSQNQSLRENSEEQNSIKQIQQQYQNFRILNQKHLQYLYDHEKQQYDQYKKWEAKTNTFRRESKQARQTRHSAVTLQAGDETIIKTEECEGDLLQLNIPTDKKLEDEDSNQYVRLMTNKIQQTLDTIQTLTKKKSMAENQSKLAAKYLSVEECEIVERQLQQDIAKCNYEAVLPLIQKLQYFRILTFERIQKILEISTLQKIEADQTIIQKDSRADYLYILVKGFVQKQVTRKIGQIRTVLTESIFQGEIFGYLDKAENYEEQETYKNSEQLRRKRRMTIGCYNYSVQAKKKSTLLKIPSNKFLSFQSELIKSELSHKIKVLKMIPCFEYSPDSDLIPLASLLVQKSFSNADIIVKEGQKADYMYIITKGVASVVKNDLIVKKKTAQDWGVKKSNNFYPSSSTNSFHKPTNTNYNTGTFRYDMKSDEESRKKQGKGQVLQKTGIPRVVAEDQQKYAFEFNYKMKQLFPGQIILKRAVLRELEEYKEAYDIPAKISIIAESNDCELMTLSGDDVQRIPDYLLKPLVRFCLEQKDFDAGFDKQQNINLKKWEQYKTNLCNQILKDKQNARAKAIFH